MRRRKRGDDNADVNAEASGGKRLSEMNMATELYFDDGAGDTSVVAPAASPPSGVIGARSIGQYKSSFDVEKPKKADKEEEIAKKEIQVIYAAMPNNDDNASILDSKAPIKFEKNDDIEVAPLTDSE